MNKFIWLILICFPVYIGINAQTKAGENHSSQNINCKTCHTCDVPTKQNPCLAECPRQGMVTVYQPAEKGPDIVSINQLVKKYMPVNFSHRAHAQMSQMSGGCASCHHFNTVGPILPCDECHSKERKREDLSKPDLQAAYHRQCMSCHKEWNNATGCSSCHAPMGSSPEKQITGIVHPEVNQPEKLVYETNYEKGKIVTFFHNEHVNLFHIECASCHRDESCTRCHDTQNPKTISTGLPEKITKPASQHHQQCFACHEKDRCSRCHFDKPSGPFNHKTSTGWALGKYHNNLECIRCHPGNKFTSRSTECTSCHKNFAKGSFNHAVTGLKLNESHAELDCSNCHKDNNFSVNPDCTECHNDKSYPDDKPGGTVKRGSR